MQRIRVILADGHAVARMGIRYFLEEEGDIDVLAEAGDGETAKRMIAQHRPDVVVLDIRMPRASGIEVTRWVRQQNLPVGVLILSACDDDPLIVAALQAGANGYLLKNAEPEQLMAAVRAIYHGESAFDPTIAQKIVAHLVPRPSAISPEPLTDRERAVLDLAAKGLSNRGVGLKLAISDRTVQGHLARIYEKLQVGSRTEAVTKAIQLGWIKLQEHTA